MSRLLSEKKTQVEEILRLENWRGFVNGKVTEKLSRTTSNAGKSAVYADFRLSVYYSNSSNIVSAKTSILLSLSMPGNIKNCKALFYLSLFSNLICQSTPQLSTPYAACSGVNLSTSLSIFFREAYEYSIPVAKYFFALITA